jgi:hypothetical protein
LSNNRTPNSDLIKSTPWAGHGRGFKSQAPLFVKKSFKLTMKYYSKIPWYLESNSQEENALASF